MVIPSKERNLLSRAVIPAPPSVIPDIFLIGNPVSLLFFAVVQRRYRAVNVYL